MSVSIALIPARGGSKRVPRKNVRRFAGRPMLEWPISTALESGLFNRVLVSTDDEEIAEAARKAGAEIPFMRPAELSDDHAGTRPVIRHAIEAIENAGESVARVCCLYATSPFVTVEDLKAGHDALTGRGARFAFAAASYAHPVQRAFRVLDNGGVEMVQPEYRLTRTQDLEEFYHDAGMFYWGTRDGFFSDEAMFSPSSHPVIIPRERVHDIDTPEDWARAELAFKVASNRDA